MTALAHGVWRGRGLEDSRLGKRKLINFVSNLDLGAVSGGSSAVNAAAHEALSEMFDVHYVGPVNPPPSLPAKAFAKALRSVGLASAFAFFSRTRLQRIADEVARTTRHDASLDFFQGFTPWVQCAGTRPYAAWSDCCFQDYIDIFHASSKFAAGDIKRICDAERAWMQRASGIFLSSEWARQRVSRHYGLAEQSLRNVGIFGAMDIPENDSYQGDRVFLFVSTDYARKNGPVTRQAMNYVWQQFPDARLKIIGAAPPPEDLTDERVTYEGYFDKSKPSELAAFTRHIAEARALVHPTSADTTAMIVIEAAFHGCPSITVNDFALPEVTGHGTFAVLLERPVRAQALATAMMSLLADGERYVHLRQRARAYSAAHFSRSAFKARLQEAVGGVCGA
jgi:glycosyltransferase involved in cell wall biosynthesis